ncbi:MAG: hypothetical protein AAF745_01345 [Planctomycetota bacterium]
MPPQIANGGYATMADCRLITPPSSYTAMSAMAGPCGCGPMIAPAGYAAIGSTPPIVGGPVTNAPLAGTPGTLVPTTGPVIPGLATTNAAAPAGSLITFGQEQYPVQVGQGLWGQPVAYVPGQTFRNWLRYFSF